MITTNTVGKIRILNNDSFNLVKKASFLALLFECVCEKNDININEFYLRIREVEEIWNLNNDDPELCEIISRENKPRDMLCKEKLMQILNDF